MAHRLLADRWVHFLATDAHNSHIASAAAQSEARRLVAKKYGEEYATDLTTRHPLAAFEGRQIDPTEEPRNLYEEYQERSWWQRLLD